MLHSRNIGQSSRRDLALSGSRSMAGLVYALLTSSAALAETPPQQSARGRLPHEPRSLILGGSVKLVARDRPAAHVPIDGRC
jgi:hypothetical protein